MSSPMQPELPVAMTIEDMEQVFKEETPAKPAFDMAAVVEGDGIPDTYKGQSVKSLVDQAEAYRRALDISEQGRMSAMRAAQGIQQPAPTPAPAPKEYTREELAEMMASDDPNVRLQAVDLAMTQGLNRARVAYDERLNQLTQSTLSTAEAEARRAYPKEFELFGDQIAQFSRQIPADQLTSAQAWKQLVQHVRGLDNNIQQYIAAIATPTPPAERARQVEQSFAGFTATPVRSPSPTPASVVVDEFTAAIAKELGWDPVKYAQALANLDK